VKHTFDWTEACPECKATGIYRGCGELPGAGVVCYKCKGTGERKGHIEWDDFEGKQLRDDVLRVYIHNPGIGVDADPIFGGMPYADWWEGKPFPKGSEMRWSVCPAWWYQGVGYKKKPRWDECVRCGAFSDCKHFGTKHRCWERWDRENPQDVEK
jgi:hypothetical protein